MRNLINILYIKTVSRILRRFSVIFFFLHHLGMREAEQRIILRYFLLRQEIGTLLIH